MRGRAVPDADRSVEGTLDPRRPRAVANAIAHATWASVTYKQFPYDCPTWAPALNSAVGRSWRPQPPSFVPRKRSSNSAVRAASAAEARGFRAAH